MIRQTLLYLLAGLVYVFMGLWLLGWWWIHNTGEVTRLQ